MCRRIVIECLWDDETPEDAAGLFDRDNGFDSLTEFAENVIVKEVSGMFEGSIKVMVERVHG